MIKFRRTFLLISLTIFFVGEILAQVNPTDTATFQVEQEGKQIEDDLDSLLNLWYVKNAIKSTESSINVPDNEIKIKDVSDSVLIERLNAIPSLIELPFNQVIRRYIELYTRGKLAPALLGLADYYFPMFEEILDKYNLPLELKYLPIIESALNPRAVSRAGATGLWQFMYGTGRMYQLEINSYVDERRDPYRASIAAAKFLSNLYAVYGDWTLALAAYNCGPGNVNKAIRRAHGKRDYWEIYPYLPRETRNYVPAFVGAAYMLNYYDRHNIVPLEINMPMMTDTIMIDKKLHLEQVSKVLGMDMNELRDLNPQYKRDIIPATVDTYPLRLPFEKSTAFIDLQDSIYNYNASVYLNPKRVVITPHRYSTSKYSRRAHYEYSPEAEAKRLAASIENKTKLTYVVKNGDNLGFISDWYKVKIADIKLWNHLRSSRLSIGQKLAIYIPNKKVYRFRKINNLTFEQKNKFAYKKTVAKGVNESFKYDDRYTYYKIRKGDNLWTIAKKFDGVSNTDIIKINNFNDEDVKRLRPGKVIKIKPKG